MANPFWQKHVLHLLASEGHFDSLASDAYCVYEPLLVANLHEVVKSYQLDIIAKKRLFLDYLSGLAYLHDDKGIMHRAINPNNLAIRSFSCSRGVIIDLDAALDAPTSTDHMEGTLPYLAPEIISPKQWEHRKRGNKPDSYNNRVDLWALGLSMLVLFQEKPFSWRKVDHKQTDDFFTPDGLVLLREKLESLKKLCTQRDKLFLDWILTMINLFRTRRNTAMQLRKVILKSAVDSLEAAPLSLKRKGGSRG